jgi:hypothetical protein
MAKEEDFHMMKTEDLTSTMDKTVKSTQTYSYKKIKVSKSLADKIEMQQWALINAVITDGVPW